MAAPADIILYDGRVVTIDDNFSVAEAVAIKDGKFMVVGTSTAVNYVAGPETQLVDLCGRTAIPGLIDAHIHQMHLGMGLHHVQLFEARSISDMKEAIGKMVSKTPPGEWIIASSAWHESQLEEKRLPNRWELDTIAPDHPVFVPRGGHVCVVNSLPLEMANITSETSDPPGGVIVKDPETGEPTGVLYETARRHLIQPLLPSPTYESKVDGIKSAMRSLNKFGVTSVCEAGINPREDDVRAYLEVWAGDEVTVRTEILLRVENARKVDELSKYYSSGFGSDFLKIGGLKVRVDGGVEGAYMKKPYRVVPGLQEDEEYRGCLMLVPGGEDEFKKILLSAARGGWKVVGHVVGDAGIEYFVDRCEEIDHDIPIRDLRWAAHHVFLPTNGSIEKMKELGFVASGQDHPTYLGWNQLRLWGPERAGYAVPLRKLLDSGIIVGGGTDAPVVPHNPFLSIWWMVTRKTMTAGPDPLGPEQAITVNEALRVYTINSAYCLNWEEKIGSIEVGKLADIVVLDTDILTCPEDDIRNINVLMTIIDGKIVYNKMN